MNILALHKAFDKIHEQIAIIERCVQEADDAEGDELVAEMQMALLGPVRKLRLRYNVPYHSGQVPK